MEVPPIAKATLQAAVINAGSNALAQGISAYRDERPFNLDLQTLLQFTTCAFTVSPMAFRWLEFLEFYFPGSSEPDKSQNPESKERADQKPKLNVKNTVAKVVLDQTIGGAWFTVIFIATMGAQRGLNYEVILEQIQNDFWPIMIAGFKLWPFVSILNFTVVPADKRLLVGSLFGVVWAVYLSLISG